MDSVPLSRRAVSNSGNLASASGGRIVSLGHAGCAWNNLGRNIVFANASLRPLAIFGDTMFPEDDEASQFDLDIHAIVELADTGQIAVLNHPGVLCGSSSGRTEKTVRLDPEPGASGPNHPGRDPAARLCRRRREGDRAR